MGHDPQVFFGFYNNRQILREPTILDDYLSKYSTLPPRSSTNTLAAIAHRSHYAVKYPFVCNSM